MLEDAVLQKQEKGDDLMKIYVAAHKKVDWFPSDEIRSEERV